ncbi:hypothetical protein CBR_g23089 [Chara braunii]|uniref:Reverse transcriptase domain-containing protein n=1 Tax=Chara braunii TaxID=69332 RepID=A0A388L3I9_CHABU|nr:hypothetical protein CBR_g23089 [Chara braunii]|eukprot:GBG76874.1 hypothetical protein CBR_g23089 [Chara braunii]
MDDILVFSKTHEYRVEHIEWVLHALKDVGFKVALEKSEFFFSEISFLGYIVTVDGLKPDSRKVAADQDTSAPVTLTQARAFLGLASYYRRFIKGFAGIAKPLTNLLKKEEQLIWTPESEVAFQALKEALKSAPVLAHRLLRHQFNEERQLRYDIQQVNVPAPGVADLAAYSLLCDRLTYVGVYVDVTQLPGRETTRVFIEFRALQVAPNFVHSVDTFIGDLTILPQENREPARSFVREYAVEAARSVARVQGRSEHRFTAHEVLLRRAEDRPIALFFVDHEDHVTGEHFVVYYVITRPKPAEKEGTVALYPFVQLQTIDPRFLELIHLELLSIGQVIASEEEEIQPRLQTATTPWRTYNEVVILDYIAQRAERLDDFPEERPLRPPSSYSRPAPPKAPKKTPKRKRCHPLPGVQGSRIGGGEEVIQPARAATLIKETIVPSPPIPIVPDLNLDGAGPSSTAAARGGSRMGFPDSISRPPVLAGPLRDSLSELIKVERRRVTERAQDSRWQGPTLQKRKVDDDGESSWLTVPHPLARFDWTRAAHEEDAVHFAVKFTKKAIEKNGWYWSGIREDVKYIVQNCLACAADKAPVQMPRTMVPTRVERPFQRFSIDTTDINVPRGSVDQGELNVLLVAVDHFSKWIEAYPMTSRNSQEVAWMNHRQPEHEPLEHFQTPLADRLLWHRFNEERQLRYDIQQVDVPAPGVADLAVYSLLCDRLTYAGVYVDVTQLPGWETTRVFIEFCALQVAPNFVHSVATFIGDLTVLLQQNREPARSFVREYVVEAARSVARVQGRGGHRFTAHEVLLRRAEDGPIALVPQLPVLLPPAAPLNLQAIPPLTEGPYPMREFSEYLVELTDVESLRFADEDAWELHRALYKSVALGMFRFFVDHEDHAIGEHFVVYYVIARPKPAEKEGTVALYPFAPLQTIDPGLLELIHLELLSIAQVIASEEEEIQPRLRTATAPRRTYNRVVIPDYIAKRAERLEDFPEERPLRPPLSYPRPAPPKAPKKTPKRKRRHPSPGAQGSRIGGGEEVIQLARIPDPVPGSAATLVKETIVPSPPILRVPDLNLDGDGPSATAAAGGGSQMGFPDPISRPPLLAGPLFHPSRTVHLIEVDFMVEPATIRLEAIVGAPRPDPAWEPYLTPPFQGCIAARLAGTLIYETGQRPNAMYHFLVFAAQKRERRPYTETHVVMTGPGPRSVRKRVVRAVADLAPRVLSHVPGGFLYPSFVQHHFHEGDAPTTPAAMAVFLPPIPPPLNPDIDHFL